MCRGPSNAPIEQRPFVDTKALREAFQDAVLTGSSEQQLELLNAFHDLGAEDETGHALAVDHVALSNLDDDDHNDVVQLAAAYREHFGFPLIICARETEHFDRVLQERLVTHGQLARRREGVRADRGRQDRQLPVHRSGRRRESDCRGAVQPAQRTPVDGTNRTH